MSNHLEDRRNHLAHACQLMHEEWRISKLLSRNSVTADIKGREQPTSSAGIFFEAKEIDTLHPKSQEKDLVFGTARRMDDDEKGKFS